MNKVRQQRTGVGFNDHMSLLLQVLTMIDR